LGAANKVANPLVYNRIHELLAKQAYSVQGIADSLGISRVTATRVLKSSDDIVEHQTWPRTYSLRKGSSYVPSVVKKEEEPLTKTELELAQNYLQILLNPETTINIAAQFQAVDSIEGADQLIKALSDCVKVAEYYKLLLLKD
jgi:hypothetical protein